MARPTSRFPTDLELEILKIIWRDGPANVRHVRDTLEETRGLAYTSVMTVMNIMDKKKYLARKKVGGSFVYTPRISEQDTSQRMLSDLVDRVFNGSAAAVVLRLVETSDIDSAELDELRRMIENKGKEPGE